LALRRDGTILAWGDGTFGKTIVPSYATNVFALAAGGMHSLALVNDPTAPTLPLFGRQPASRTVQVGDTLILQPEVSGAFTYQWQCNGTNIPGATTSFLTLNAVELAQNGSYSLLAANPAGTVRSEAAIVLVWPAIHLQQLGPEAVISWDGPFVLQAATEVTGPYLDVPDATSPVTNDLVSTPVRFFRLRQPLGPLSIRAP
jgi:hypothetical protein